SVNCSRMKRTFSALQTFRISDLDRPGPAASNLRIFAFGILRSFFCTLRRILAAFRKESIHFLKNDTEDLQSCTNPCAKPPGTGRAASRKMPPGRGVIYSSL